MIYTGAKCNVKGPNTVLNFIYLEKSSLVRFRFVNGFEEFQTLFQTNKFSFGRISHC